MINSRRIKSTIACVLAFGILLTGCSGDNNTEGKPAATAEGGEVKEYKYGEIEIPALDGALCGAPLYIAYEKGFLAEEGFDAKLTAADFETKKVGLNNGTIPLVNGDFQFFPSIEQGVKVKVVDGMHNGCIKVVTSKDSGIKSAADLKGAKIGVDEIGGTTFQATSLWLENNGIEAENNKDVTFVPYSDGNLEIEAVEKGEIKAAAVWDPLGSQAINEKGFVELFDLATDKLFADKFCCFYFASEKVAEENPEEIAAILRALRKAENWIVENTEEAVKIIGEGDYSSITDEKLAADLLKSYAFPKEGEDIDRKLTESVVYFSKELAKIDYLETDDGEAFAKEILIDNLN
ncbi:MAG: ABC transporter substrate-binding protein [Eubacterium sp.]|nr:ABC transporter substrate-binding protein [Eubacterium sp.]